MKIERTHDMDLVYSIMANESIWPHIHDDFVKEPNPVDHDQLYWMLISDDHPAGVFLVHAVNSVCYQMHTCLLPRIWGDGAAQAAKLLGDWVFNEMNCMKLITAVPAYNRAAFRFAKAGGMTQEGINRASFMRNGKLIDQIMLGVTKEEWTCLQQSR